MAPAVQYSAKSHPGAFGLGLVREVDHESCSHTWVGYLLWYRTVRDESEPEVPGKPSCCFKWLKMDFLEFAQLLTKEETL